MKLNDVIINRLLQKVFKYGDKVELVSTTNLPVHMLKIGETYTYSHIRNQFIYLKEKGEIGFRALRYNFRKTNG